MPGKIGRGHSWNVVVLGAVLLCSAVAGGPAPGEALSWDVMTGVVSGDAPSRTLLRYLVDRLEPEGVDVVLDAEPDAQGRIGHLYIDLQGPRLGGVRVERFRVEALDVLFNAVEAWNAPGEDPIEVRSALQTYAEAVLLERDINDDLFRKQVGEDDANWKNLRLDFSPEGIYARGNYHVEWGLSFNILIELSGKLAVRSGREIWLEDYTFRVNRMGVPDWLAEQAVGKLQPILDLGRFFFPVRLKTLTLSEEQAYLASPVLPQPFEGGVAYRYRAAP